MAVTELTLDEVRNALLDCEGELSVAASNSSTCTVVSGELRALQRFVSKLESEHVFCKLVNVDYAAHSSLIDPLLGDLRELLQPVKPARATALYSTVLGRRDANLLMDAEYWATNLRQPSCLQRRYRSFKSGHTTSRNQSASSFDECGSTTSSVSRLSRRGHTLVTERREPGGYALPVFGCALHVRKNAKVAGPVPNDSRACKASPLSLATRAFLAARCVVVRDTNIPCSAGANSSPCETTCTSGNKR